MGLLQDLVNRAQGVAAQVNPLDNGRTYNTVRQQGANYTPHAPSSVLQQATHNGATNLLGSLLVKPITNTVQTGYNAGQLLADKLAPPVNPQQTAIARQQLAQHFNGSLPGFVINQPVNFGKALYYAPEAIAGDLSRHPTQAQTNAQNKGLSALNKTVVGQMVGPAESVINNVIPGARQQSINDGYNANASFAQRFIGDPLAGAAGTYGLLQGGAKIGEKVSPSVLAARDAIAAKLTPLNEKGAMATKAKAPTYADQIAQLRATNTDPMNQLSHADRLNSAMYVASQAPKMKLPNDLKSGNVNEAIDSQSLQNKLLYAKQNVPGSSAKKGLLPLDQSGHIQLPDKESVDKQNPVGTKAASPNDTLPSKKNLQPPAPTGKLSRLANVTVQKSDEVSPATKKLVKDEQVTYDPTTDKGRVAVADKQLKGKSNDAAYVHALKGLESNDSAKGQHIVTAIQAAKRLDATGTEANLSKATEIYHNLSEKLSAKGQEIQAAAILARRSPAGIKFTALKQFQKAGIDLKDLSAKDQTEFNALNKAVKNTAEDTQARADAINNLHNFVSQRVPHKFIDKAFTLWRTGLLTGPQTFTKVAASHTLQNVLENVKQLPATAIDQFIYNARKAAGKEAFRSTSTTVRGDVHGGIVGGKAGLHLLRTGQDTIGTGGFRDTAVGMLAHPDVRYGNGVIGKAIQDITGQDAGKIGTGKLLNIFTQKVGQGHAALPKAFSRSAYENDLNKQAIAAARTQGLHGQALSQFRKNFVANPTEQAEAEATHAAQMATFQQHTALGNVSKKFQSVPGGRVLAPFAHIASAILTDAEDYSPVGAGKAIVQAIKDTKNGGWTPIVQKHFVEELGRSITGTGAVYTGYQLYQHGLMTLNYPTSPKEQALWKAQGKQENSILINGKWRSTASLGPIGTVLAAGGFVGESKQGKITKGKAASTVADALEGALENITSQSFLSGTTGFAQAVANPAQNGKSYVQQQVASTVPIAVQTVAKATDSQQRQSSGVINHFKSVIPGERETLPVQVNPYGQTLPRQGGVLTNLLDPTRPQNAVQNDSVTNELQRLSTATGTTNNAIPQQPKSFTGTNYQGKSVQVTLTPAQKTQILQSAGPTIHSTMQQIINDPRYQSLSDDEKNSILSYVTTDYTNLAKANLGNNLDGGLQVQLTKDQKSILSGQAIDYFNKLNSNNATTKATKAVKATKAPKATQTSLGLKAAKGTTTKKASSTATGAAVTKSLEAATRKSISQAGTLNRKVASGKIKKVSLSSRIAKPRNKSFAVKLQKAKAIA